MGVRLSFPICFCSHYLAPGQAPRLKYTHAHKCTRAQTHTLRVSSLCWWRSFTVVWSPHTQHSRGVFLSLPSFSFSTEQAKSRGSAGLWRVEAANFLWALWSLAAHPWRLNQRWSSEDIGEQTSLAVLLWTRGQICITVLLFFKIPPQSNHILQHWVMTFEVRASKIKSYISFRWLKNTEYELGK